MIKAENIINKIKTKNNPKNYSQEEVDHLLEKENDPKYKTELCKSWLNSSTCKYGNKCRFAHGKNELYQKETYKGKYKLKECKSFNTLGYCIYGIRCNFIHDARKIENLERSYFIYSLYTYKLHYKTKKRLNVFSKFVQSRTADCSPILYQ